MAPAKDTVLIVDDNFTIAVLRAGQIDQALRGHGYKTQIVESLEEAKTALATGKIAGVVTDNDFLLKAGDLGSLQNNLGIELVKHIRATDKDLPILWNSGRFEQATLDGVRAAHGEGSVPLVAGEQNIDIGAHTKAIEKNLPDENKIVRDYLADQLGVPRYVQTQAMGGGGGIPR